jgi:hypothetical protein
MDMRGVDFVSIGRIVALLVIGVGFLLAIWNAADTDYLGGSERMQLFFSDVLYWGALGTIVLLASEIVSRLGAGGGDRSP